jgi:hypothetical protein
MKKVGFLITLLFLISACGSSPKHVSTSKDSKKNNHAKRGSQTYVPGTGEENTLEDIIYNSLGHRKGSGVRYSQYIEQNGKFDIPVTYNDAVNKWIDYFTGAGRGHFERYLARSGRFVPYMHAVLDQYNLPKDLVSEHDRERIQHPRDELGRGGRFVAIHPLHRLDVWAEQRLLRR